MAAAFGLIAAFFFHARDLRANACVWNSTSGGWTDVARWSSCGGTSPGAADSASISGGTVTLSSNQSVTGLTFSGGTIDGTGNLAVSGAFSWTGGTMSGSGTTTIAVGGTVTINSGAVGVQRTITNNGTISRVAGQLPMVLVRTLREAERSATKGRRGCLIIKASSEEPS